LHYPPRLLAAVGGVKIISYSRPAEC